MTNPLISICILTWNRPGFLEMCLADLSGKMFYKDNCEIIIMVDGPTAQLEKVLRKYSENNLIKIIRNKKHKGINGYKKLFRKSKGDYLIEVDDDVLEFPLYFDRTLVEYMNTYSDYGFLALNVIQNEFTNGAKPDDSHYTDDMRNGKIVQKGPTGGWCACFRRRDYRKIMIPFNLIQLSMKKSQDRVISGLLLKYFKLKRGIIKNEICFHASGPYYAKKYGYLETEIEKYETGNLPSFADDYKKYRNK
jgi:glycosyltransferase involved in cell wall biosynthesis